MLSALVLRCLSRADPVLGDLIRRVGPLQFEARRRPPFESLTHAIIYQQLNGKAADTIFARFRALFPGTRFPSPDQILRCADGDLRGAGLSRQKIGYLRAVAEFTTQGLMPTLDDCDGRSDEDLICHLTRIKGVGPWTVEMLLIFDLGRPDVLPVHDYGLRAAFQSLYRKRQLPTPQAFLRYGERWRPHRTAASLYLWRVRDSDGAWGKSPE